MVRISEIVSAAWPRVFRWVCGGCRVVRRDRPGEAVPERVEDVVGGLACVVQPGELTAEHRSVEQSRRDRPAVANGAAASIVTSPAASTTPVRNPIDERWPSPMPRTLITNRRLPAAAPFDPGGPRCWGCTGRPLNRVLAGERRPQQQHSCLRHLPVGVQAIGEFAGVPTEGAHQIAVTPVEAGDDIVQRRAAPRPRPGQGCAPGRHPRGTPGARTLPAQERTAG